MLDLFIFHEIDILKGTYVVPSKLHYKEFGSGHSVSYQGLKCIASEYEWLQIQSENYILFKSHLLPFCINHNHVYPADVIVKGIDVT